MSKNVIGLKSLQRKLNAIGSDKIYTKALGQAGLVVEAAAIKKVPVDTGILRSSIGTQVDTAKMEARIGTNMEYGPYVEFGTGLHSSLGTGRATPWSYQNAKGQWITTSGQMAQPFMGPSLRENTKKVKEKFIEVLNKEVAK